MDIQYVGEHLFWGYAGRFALFMAFFSALFAAWSYYRSSSKTFPDSLHWRGLGRKAFWLHSAMVGLAAFALLFILLNRYYEYRYVWIQVENALPLSYRIASFWAGQEGSLLFWACCQVVFGLVLIRFARNWEASVMTVFAFSQVFLISMLLGIRFGAFSLGLDPFLLLRMAPENLDNHFFHNPQYLALITDGNGLNPLLRNFWMLSHPPVTFVGYAAVLVPFSYALAGLWKRQFHAWIRPALPWTNLAVLFLGAGILLGGVWAYESLTFGGFWAWDPIENASLVPWLMLVAGLHLMLVSHKKKHAFFPAFLFIILSLIFVIYATYLTRSGVLSETSVHSFGRDGMGWHILIYLSAFLILSLSLLFANYRRFPSRGNEEVFTREFWLFVGALVLVLSAFQIIFSTSIPVMNRVFGSHMAPPADVVAYYNKWQLPFAVVVGLLMGVTQFIGWGHNSTKRFFRQISLSLILAFGLALVSGSFISDLRRPDYLLMLFASLFALFSSLDMLLRFRGKWLGSGAAVTHLGMGMFLLAVVLTFSQKTTISENTSGYFMGENFSPNENLLLIRGEILPMGEYHVSYAGREFDGERYHYQIDFLRTGKQGHFYRVFTAYPSILLNQRMGNVYEPYARVHPLKDVFTYVTFAELPEPGSPSEDYALIDEVVISLNETLMLGNNKLVSKDIRTEFPDGSGDPGNARITAVLEILTHYNETYELQPSFILKDGMVIHEDVGVRDLDLKFRFQGVSDEPYTIFLNIYEARPDFVIIKTVIFPYINLLWISMVVISAGLWMAYRDRRRLAAKTNNKR